MKTWVFIALALMVPAATLLPVAFASPSSPSSVDTWEYAYLRDWWHKPQGFKYYPRQSWSTGRQAFEAESWEQLLGAMGMTSEEFQAVPEGVRFWSMALDFAGKQGWELVSHGTEPVIEGVGQYWMVNHMWTFKRKR